MLFHDFSDIFQPTLYKVTEAVGMKEDFCFYMFELLIPENPPEEDRQLKELLVYRHPSTSTSVEPHTNPVSVHTSAPNPTTMVVPAVDHHTDSPTDSSAHHHLGVASIILIM